MDKKTLFVAVISMFLALPGVSLAFHGGKDLDATPIFKSEVTATSVTACTDSDSGLDYLVKGSVQSQSGTGIFKSSDRCLSRTKILEYTCKNDAWYANYYECEFGCSSGACLASEASSDTGTSADNDSDIDILPWNGSAISDFLDQFLGNIEGQGFDFDQIISQEAPDAEDIEDYFSDFISDIDFEDADIEDEEDLEEYLDDYIEGAAEEDDDSTVSSGSITFPDGTLIRIPGEDKVYVIKDGMKDWIETAEEFNAGGYDWKAIKEVNKETLKDIKDQIKLIKDELNKVFQVIDGKAIWIPSVAAFNAAGFKWGDVEDLDGNISDYYDEVKLLQDEDGNFYHITANGKKQLITNQEALESLMEELGDEGGSMNELETIIQDYMEEMLAAAEENDTEAMEEISTALSDEIQQAIDEIVNKITESLGTDDTSADIDSTDWEEYLEDLMAEFGEGSLSGMTPEEIEEEMESIWEEFEDQMGEFEDTESSSSVTVTTTQGSGTGETWEEAWEDLLANMETTTATTTESGDDEIAAELEEAWEGFEEMFGSEAGSSDWSDFLSDYDYSSSVPSMEEILGEFQDSEDYEDLDSYLSGYGDILGGDATDLSDIFDFEDIFDMSSFKGLGNYLDSIEDTKLIQEEGDYKVYEIVNGQKNWITSAEELANKGYSWGDIVRVNPTVFGAYGFDN